ncbi:protein ELC-like isoform X2 [Andrographis paniculata]|uniref:protein ELC-like isoform X2 n=1 Tax=Andrographis paniculata TaxID=175694 RepID=UPI0021E73494|nr:protein ELC-like isoform X2 [Andrographis paniculata]
MFLAAAGRQIYKSNPSIDSPRPHNAPMAQYTQQFLNSVLSQRGPSALPYAEDMKWHIRQHLLYLTEAYPSLQPKTAVFTHNDGRTVNLLQADGTVPMTFQGVTYNIPVIIWLMESYPRHAPLVFVNPTRDMIIKRPHPFVSPNGVVSVPYLHSWVFPASNLVELARNLSHFFARDPPLYSQRKASNPNLNQSYGSANSSAGSTPARPAIPPRDYPPSPTPPAPYGSGRVMDDPAEVFKKNAINKLVESLNGDIKNMRKSREGEMEGLFATQAVLRKREEDLTKGLKEMQDEKEALEQQLQMVLMNSDVLEGWIRENESKLRGNDVGNIDIDECFEPCDALSKQMMDCTALDLAVEDTIYALDKAVQEGAVPFDQYLRNVRLLAREQFFHRATSSKVRAIQMQAQVASMAARAPPSQYAF